MADVQMDYGTVQTMANVLGTAAGTLSTVNGALATVSAILTGAAFLGGVSAAAAVYVENVRQYVSTCSSMCNELSSDVNGAIKAIRDGDMSGSQRFV
jgi:hypothetical protein